MTYSPHDLLPAPVPSTVNPPEGEFYNSVVKHLLPTTIRLMNTGIPIDLNRVEQLETELDQIIAEVHTTLAANTHIQTYLQQRYSSQIAEYQALQMSRLKPASTFLVPFNASKVEHRSYFMHIYSQSQSLPTPEALLPTGIPKWSVRDIQKLSASRPILQRLLSNSLRPSETTEAMQLYADHKADLRNKSTRDKINTPTIAYPTFNPSSPIQKGELFTMLNLKSEGISKTTGADKWDRSQLERLLKESNDPILTELLQALIDFSFAAIVRNNFIEAFYNYTVDGRLHGSYKLFGAKSFRFTSSNPNMLNTPSSKSRFSKPIKRCFVAPPGFIVAGIDYSALEDRVIANLTHDKNKIILQTDPTLDGHLFHAATYFKSQLEAILGPLPHRELAIAAKVALDAGNTDIKKYRDLSKNVTFGASYGAFPPKIAATIKCTLPEAETIFNAYHNDMYPGITHYRENYVLPTATSTGKLHLGLGCYIKTDNANRDIRTLHNATAQFWSILTLLSMHKLQVEIDKADYTSDIQITSSIYDAIYMVVRDDATIVKWLNDTLIPIMEQDFLPSQVVHNRANLEIGTDWSNISKHELPHDATLTQIQETLDALTTLSD